MDYGVPDAESRKAIHFMALIIFRRIKDVRYVELNCSDFASLYIIQGVLCICLSRSLISSN